MSKALIVGAVVVLAGIGAWAIIGTGTGETPTEERTSPSTPEQRDTATGNRQTSDNAPKSSAQVSYTDEGFTPRRITIEAGDTVTWINDTDSQMWVASSVHPTHGELPGFDQRKSVGSGGQYSFQFDQTGEWEYHNHLNPSRKGTVIVEQ